MLLATVCTLNEFGWLADREGDWVCMLGEGSASGCGPGLFRGRHISRCLDIKKCGGCANNVIAYLCG